MTLNSKLLLRPLTFTLGLGLLAGCYHAAFEFFGSSRAEHGRICKRSPRG